jgi:hypothetical protein
MQRLRGSVMILLLWVLGFVWVGAARGEFPLRDGDVWVMAGDSITVQRMHTNYFEAFCFARYPQWKFGFRNAGVGGHTIPKTLARFDYDIAACQPTIVSVELGMNDKAGSTADVYIENMGVMVGKITAIHARPVIFSASPLNDGSTMAKLTFPNQRLNDYAVALKDFCAERKLPYADQFHALIDVWGMNKQSKGKPGRRGRRNDSRIRPSPEAPL